MLCLVEEEIMLVPQSSVETRYRENQVSVFAVVSLRYIYIFQSIYLTFQLHTFDSNFVFAFVFVFFPPADR